MTCLAALVLSLPFIVNISVVEIPGKLQGINAWVVEKKSVRIALGEEQTAV